jgi:acyl dehydratase
MIDRKWIGYELPPSTIDVERRRLRAFAGAIGETNPIYLDPDAARAAGHPDILAPPTFLFSAELDSGTLMGTLESFGVDVGKLLHGEQSFTYYAPVHAGDRVTVRSRITDIYDKKHGALEFIVKDSTATEHGGKAVADLRSVLIVRHGERA